MKERPQRLCAECAYEREYNQDNPIPQVCKDCGSERKNWTPKAVGN